MPEGALPLFALDDERGFRAWLDAAPRAVVLLRGVGCPYSASFEKVFREVEPPEGIARAIRLVEEGGRGPVAEAFGAKVTPTVLAYEGPRERDRLAGVLLLGITRARYGRWLRALA